MPPASPYAGQHSQQPFPALYLYPLNDSFVPKHISLVANQRVKIGRQTNPKTAPGEKNGFFDSKVLSRQHAEVWEDGGKIYIKDVKSSNGTFINGERLSPEGVESDPYELKSDDIVEFGIDIVGEDNKTIIHHKVAARAVCVFSEQDAQVAARAEQHQQQQQQQLQLQHQHQHQHQQQQQGYGPHSLMGAGQPGPNGMPSQFNFVAGPQQRRAGPGVSQGLAGMGGMGGSVRPPGKSGLTFEHILSRLQGELQKSRETGSELHSLTGSITEIHEVLGGNIPPNLPPYPSSLPPVRPGRQSSPSHPSESNPPASSSSPPPDLQQQEQNSAQTDPPLPRSTSPAIVISELQNQLHHTQTSLAEHADKVRALEDVLADQELIRKEVRDLRHLIENRRREIMFEREHGLVRQGEESGLLEPRGGFDHEDEDDDVQHIRMLDEVDDDEDARSISTIIPHELERVDEEDEGQVAAAERDEPVDERSYDDDRADPIDPEREREHNPERQNGREREIEEAEHEALRRKQEDLNVGRPRTPEPMSFGLREREGDHSTTSPRTRSGTLLAPNSRSPSSPLSHTSTASSVSNDEILEQVLQLSAQITAMVKLTSSMEAQHNAAQTTIKLLETKVTELEKSVKEKENQDKAVAQVGLPLEQEVSRAEGSATKIEEEEGNDREGSLTAFFTEWKKTVEGQWGVVKEEWREERERLNKAREDWESKMRAMDNGLERMTQLQGTTSALVKDLGAQKLELSRIQDRVHSQFQQVVGLRVGNGDVVKHGHGSGLVTPPSPRSQSSDSGGGRRRRKRRSGSGRARGRSSGSGSERRSRSISSDPGESSDDATLASEEGLDCTKLPVFGNGMPNHAASQPKNLLKVSSSGNVIHFHSTAAPADDSLPKSRTPVDGMAISRAYYFSASKERVFDYEDGETGSSVEDDEEDGRKVSGPKDLVALATPASMSASLVSEGRVGVPSDVDAEQKQALNQRNAINFQTAGAVVVLAVAAAAVLWKVRQE